MSEIRPFIPVGSCVEDAAQYFDSLDTEVRAAKACRACPQLDNCMEERELIGALALRNGSPSAVVAARKIVMSLDRAHTVSEANTKFGEVTLQKFDFSPPSSDGPRILRSIQRAVRLRHITRYTETTHPTDDMDAYYQAALEASDPENAVYTAENTLALRYAVSALLRVTAERYAGGGLLRPHLRYLRFDRERYVPYITAFMNEAREIKELGLPQHEGKLTLFHTPEYYRQYLAAGRAQGITDSRLGEALHKSSIDPMPVAQDLKDRAARDKQQRIAKQKEVPPLPPDVQQRLCARSANPEKSIAYVQQLRKYHILEVNTETSMLELHSTLAHHTRPEQRAIVLALNRRGVKLPRASGPTKVSRAVVSNVLVPYIDEIRSAVAIGPETSTKDALTILRREVWGRQIVFTNTEALAQTLPEQYFESLLSSVELTTVNDKDVATAAKGLQYLYTVATRYYQRQQMELSLDTFGDMAKLYLQDWGRIQAAGQRKAETVALYYSADTYEAIVAYASSDELVSKGVIAGAFGSNVRTPLKPIYALRRCFAEINSIPGVRKKLGFAEVRNLAMRGLDAKTAPEVLTALFAAESYYVNVLDRGVVRRVYTQYKLADAPTVLKAKAVVTQQYREQYGEHPAFWAIYDAIGRAKQGQELARAQAVVKKLGTVYRQLSQMGASDIDDFVATHIVRHEDGDLSWLDGYYARLKVLDALPFAGEFNDEMRHKLATICRDETLVDDAQYFYEKLRKAEAKGLSKEEIVRWLSYDLRLLQRMMRQGLTHK